ncbi:MAG: pyridoxal-phosphate dependent enzyme [Terracidiphilus sp.]|jgi:threonine synthase
MLDILRASEGVALAVTDDETAGAILDWARNEGIFLSPEGASVTAAYDKLPAKGTLQASDRVVLFIAGAELKLHGCNRGNNEAATASGRTAQRVTDHRSASSRGESFAWSKSLGLPSRAGE